SQVHLPVREYRKALGSAAGARTTRGVACTRIRHRAAPGRQRRVRGGQSTHNVSLNASAPLLHVSRCGDSRLARRSRRTEKETAPVGATSSIVASEGAQWTVEPLRT